eukprot:5398445-Heterocapsa_arctica.AAC.1
MSTIACATPSPIGVTDGSGPQLTGRLIGGVRFSTATSTQRPCDLDAEPREHQLRLHSAPHRQQCA